MLNIGCHLSTTKGYTNMGKEALAIGANTFQFFMFLQDFAHFINRKQLLFPI